MAKQILLILLMALNLGCAPDSITSPEPMDPSIYEEETYPVGTKFAPPAYNLAFDDNYVIRVDEKTSYKFQKILAGMLSLPSGKLVVTEPLVFYDQVALDVDFLPGFYPVYIAEALITHEGRVVDKRNALAKIVFNPSAKAVEWSFIESFSVVGGTGGFIDFSIMNQLIADGEAQDFSHLLLDKYNAADRSIKQPFDQYHELYRQFVDLTYKNGNLISFTTGWGDGGYNSLLGYDKTGNLVELLTDLGVIEWEKEKYLIRNGAQGGGSSPAP